MSFTISFGWWLLPTAITIGLLLGWRVFGARMSPSNGSMFPDAAGALAELAGYVIAGLLSVIVWLIWWGLQ